MSTDIGANLALNLALAHLGEGSLVNANIENHLKRSQIMRMKTVGEESMRVDLATKLSLSEHVGAVLIQERPDNRNIRIYIFLYIASEKEK